MRRKAVYWILLTLASAMCVAAEADPVTQCMRSHQCTIDVRGAPIGQPTMTLVVARGVWASWTAEERKAARHRLASEAMAARKQPERYTDIPSTAPMYQRAVDAIRKVNEYSIVLSDTDGRVRPLQISAQLERGPLVRQ